MKYCMKDDDFISNLIIEAINRARYTEVKACK